MVFGIFSKDLKTYIHTYTQKTPYMMFIAALFIVTHTWKQPNVLHMVNG